MRNFIFIIILILPLFSFGKDNRCVFDDPKEYKHLHSNYFPIEVNENLYMTDYSTLLHMMHIEYGLEYGNVGVDSIIALHMVNHIPFYCKKSPESYGLLLVENPNRICAVEDIMKNYVSDSGEIDKNPFDVTNKCGQILYSLYVNRIAVQADCITGFLHIPYVETIRNNLEAYKCTDKHIKSEYKAPTLTTNKKFEYYPLLINGVMYMSNEESTKTFFENEYDKLSAIYYSVVSEFFSNRRISLYSKNLPEKYGLVRVDKHTDVMEEFENNSESAIKKYNKLIMTPSEVAKLKRAGKLGIVLYCLYSSSVVLI